MAAGGIAHSLSEAEKTLQQVFRDLSPQELEALAAVTETRDYPADSVVCHEGELEHVFYIVQ
jgi:CRP-like cAMP-binding protein